MAEAPTSPLETGHEPSTPVGDTYQRRFILKWAEAIHALVRSLGGATIATDAFWAGDARRPAGYANVALLTRPFGNDPAATVSAIEAFYAGGDVGSPREVPIFSPWPTPNLRPHGWDLGGIRRSARCPPAPSTRPHPSVAASRP